MCMQTLWTTEGCSQLSCKEWEKEDCSSYWFYNEIILGFGPPEQVKVLLQTCSKNLSPALSSTLLEAVEGSNPFLKVYAAMKRKQDPASNCTKCLILNKLSSKTGSLNCAKCLIFNKLSSKMESVNKVRRSTQSLSWTRLQTAACMDFNEIIIHYKTTKSTIPKPYLQLKQLRKWEIFITRIPLHNNFHVRT